MSTIEIVNPEGTGRPLGQYSQVARVKASEFLFISGQLATGPDGAVVGEGDFERQCEQVFANIGAVLKGCGADWGNIVQLTYYLVHSQDVPRLMAYRRLAFPEMFPDGAYPPATLLIVDRLVQEPFLFEVTATAAL
ncbi:RidA family protein [Zavarzinia compransoris]|uniref:RidA family protein n=1 Tax=Zavarzinia marina TaxID=2911065 RepID=UPI001F1A3330|nr:RidA family protein [Zavarzinia marina]MCF4167353.1 RidA family protein [Zavarzinia marina]